jgi:hypothetical protein
MLKLRAVERLPNLFNKATELESLTLPMANLLLDRLIQLFAYKKQGKPEKY